MNVDVKEESVADKIRRSVLRNGVIENVPFNDFATLFTYAKGLEYGFNSIKNLATAIMEVKK
jgi:hypothetical protein